MGTIERWAIAGLIALGVAAACFGIGYRMGWIGGDSAARAELAPRIDALEAEREEARRQAHAVREASRTKADQLAAAVAERESRIAHLQRSLDHAISTRASAVRRALDGELTRMLNEQSAIRESRTGTPGAAAAGAAADGRPPAAAADRDRPAADDGSGTSERAVAVALSERATLYNRCRERFLALVDYVNAVTR